MWTVQKALSHAVPGQKWLPIIEIFDRESALRRLPVSELFVG